MTFAPAQSFKPETFPNGAAIVFLPYPWSAWSIVDCHGHHHGLRRDHGAAREFAASLPGSPPEPEPPAPIRRSPRAYPLPDSKFLPTGPQPDERPAPDRSMSPWRGRHVVRASER